MTGWNSAPRDVWNPVNNRTSYQPQLFQDLFHQQVVMILLKCLWFHVTWYCILFLLLVFCAHWWTRMAADFQPERLTFVFSDGMWKRWGLPTTTVQVELLMETTLPPIAMISTFIPSSKVISSILLAAERWILSMKSNGFVSSDTPPKFNSSPLKNGGWKTTFLLGR